MRSDKTLPAYRTDPQLGGTRVSKVNISTFLPFCPDGTLIISFDANGEAHLYVYRNNLCQSAFRDLIEDFWLRNYEDFPNIMAPVREGPYYLPANFLDLPVLSRINLGGDEEEKDSGYMDSHSEIPAVKYDLPDLKKVKF